MHSSTPTPKLLDPRSLQNKVLVSNTDPTVYFLPCYLRFKFKQFLGIEIQKSSASFSGTLFLTVYYKGVEQHLSALEDGITVLLNGSETIQLDKNPPSSVRLVHTKHEVVYMYRGIFTTTVGGNIFFTPFQKQKLQLTMTLNAKIVQSQDSDEKKNITLKFNLMEDHSLKEGDEFKINLAEVIKVQTIVNKGEYGIVKNSFNMQFTNSLVRQEVTKRGPKKKPKQQKKTNKRDQTKSENPFPTQQMIQNAEPLDHQNQQGKPLKLKEFHHAIFSFQIYRFPLIALLIIFLPMWILTVLNICTFFAGTDLATRLQTLSAVMIAFLAFLPTIRERVPPTADINLTDIQTYCLIGTTLLILIESTIVSGRTDYEFNWKNNGFFLATIVIIFLSVAVTAVQICYYRFRLVPKYNIPMPQAKNIEFEKRNNSSWLNPACWNHFKNKAHPVQ